MMMKSGEGTAEEKKGVNLGEKLRRAGKKRAGQGQTSPVASSFLFTPRELQQLLLSSPRQQELLQQDSSCTANNNNSAVVVKGDSSLGVPAAAADSVSSRKLGATLWEMDQYSKIHQGGGVPRLRRLNHHQLGGHEPADPSPSSPDMPGSSGNLRRHIAALMQHHRLTERSNHHANAHVHAIQPVSPASYGSSMEIAPYNPAVTPSSSIELKGRTGDANYSLRTSTELLKVLNRIWSLEEQHISNMSLIKALKKELDHARSKIKELVRVQQADRRDMEELLKQITENKLIRKNKEQEKIEAAINSMRDELEDERKLRKRSESLHRKLARELYEVKTTMASVSKDLEKERKSRSLLEVLCDEFALGIREYGTELHAMRQKSDKDWGRRDDRDQLILHVSESWLDERLQMKMQPGQENKSVVDKLSSEIDAFLQAKKKVNAKRDRRSSLESIPLNTAISAPRGEDEEDDDGDDDDSADSNCFELEKVTDANVKPEGNTYQKSHTDEKQKRVTKKPGSSERVAGFSPPGLQVKFEGQMAQAMLHGESKNRVEDEEQITTTGPGKNPVDIKPENFEAAKEDSSTGLGSSYMIENLIRNHYLLSESEKKEKVDKDYGTAASSVWRGHPSPVRQWTEKLPSRDLDISESSSKLHSEMKENTLKAKLLEARSRGQRSRSRLKASIIPNRKE